MSKAASPESVRGLFQRGSFVCQDVWDCAEAGTHSMKELAAMRTILFNDIDRCSTPVCRNHAFESFRLPEELCYNASEGEHPGQQ